MIQFANSLERNTSYINVIKVVNMIQSEGIYKPITHPLTHTEIEGV